MFSIFPMSPYVWAPLGQYVNGANLVILVSLSKTITYYKTILDFDCCLILFCFCLDHKSSPFHFVCRKWRLFDQALQELLKILRVWGSKDTLHNLTIVKKYFLVSMSILLYVSRAFFCKKINSCFCCRSMVDQTAQISNKNKFPR